MRLSHGALMAAMSLGLASASHVVLAQAPDQPPANASVPAPAPKIYTVPEGTKVLLQLRSAINTKSAKQGDGVYLSSTFPVVVDRKSVV